MLRVALVAGLAAGTGLVALRQRAAKRRSAAKQAAAQCPTGVDAAGVYGVKSGGAPATVHCSPCSEGGYPVGVAQAAPQQQQEERSAACAWLAAAALAVVCICAAAIVAAEAPLQLLAACVSFAFALTTTALLQRAALLQRSDALPPADASVLVDECEPEAPAQLQDIAGTWIKDAGASDSMEAALRLMQLNGLVRTAVRLIKGVQLKVDEATFAFGVFSVISWFKITERYPMSGQQALVKRRDMRRGKTCGSVRVTKAGALRLEYAWDEPHAGRGVDEFSLDEQGRLVVAATLWANGGTASYRQVYHRKGPAH